MAIKVLQRYGNKESEETEMRKLKVTISKNITTAIRVTIITADIILRLR